MHLKNFTPYVLSFNQESGIDALFRYRIYRGRIWVQQMAFLHLPTSPSFFITTTTTMLALGQVIKQLFDKYLVIIELTATATGPSVSAMIK